ncbi:LCP family protein [Patescibacteria group bacterium]
MKKKPIIITIIFLVIIFIIPLISKIVSNKDSASPLPNNFSPSPTPSITPTPDPLRPRNVLLLGFGGGTHQGGLLTDTMIVARIDPKTKHAWLVSIPRDLWVSLPIKSDATMGAKLNAAYAIGVDDRKYPDKPDEYKGSGNLAKYAISTITGFDIDYYAAFSFQGFTKSVDTLGGIDVYVRKNLTDPYYPIEGAEDDACGISEDEMLQRTATASGFELEKLFTCRYETLEVTRGTNHMDGNTTLKYVRSRHSDQNGGDFARSIRQKEVIQAMLEKIFALNFITKAIPFVSAWKNEIHTDVPLSQFPDLASLFGKSSEYQIHNIALTTDNILIEGYTSDRQYILMPKAGLFAWDTIWNFLRKEMKKDN